MTSQEVCSIIICLIVCGLEKNEGYCSKKEHCYSNGRYFYYDSKSGKCRPLRYKGYGGNANKFHSRKECRHACRKGYGNKCEVCPAPRYVYYSQCGCYKKGYCNCPHGYYCCPVTCGGRGKSSFKGYSCRKPIQVKCARGYGQRTCGGGGKRKGNGGGPKNTEKRDNNGKDGNGGGPKNTERRDNNGKDGNGEGPKNTERRDNNGKDGNGQGPKNTERRDNNGKDGNDEGPKKIERRDNNGKDGNVEK
ncbi:uncharacterized protein LOC143078581 [Mytilus galloprovincialis]|uniref:uncharacterized protein LOC143078581 n=1 Tax=Mytilus galloprovincialis TaxID=29158 RepID=UPI003F7C3100